MDPKEQIKREYVDSFTALGGGQSGLCQFAGGMSARSPVCQCAVPIKRQSAVPVKWLARCNYGNTRFGVRDALTPANSMLRITVHDDGTLCRLELAGRLYGPWVGETENSWRTALCAAKEIEIDIRQVTAVDNAGRALLAAMHEAGARLVAQGIEMTALVDDITGDRPFDGTRRQPRRRKVPRRPTSQTRRKDR